MDLRRLSQWSITGAALGLALVLILSIQLGYAFRYYSNQMATLDRFQHATAEMGVHIDRIASLQGTADTFDSARQHVDQGLSLLNEFDDAISGDAIGEMTVLLDRLHTVEALYPAGEPATTLLERMALASDELMEALVAVRAAQSRLYLLDADFHADLHNLLDRNLLIAVVSFGIIAMLYAIFCILTFLLLYRKINGPLVNLLDVMETSGRGNLTQRVSITGRDEFARLGIAFNRLLDHLEEREHEARRYQEGIDRSLRERKKAEEEARAQAQLLRDRVKELRCINDVTQILEDRSRDFATRAQDAVNRIPGGWQYPGSTAVRLQIDDKVYRSGLDRPFVSSMQENIRVHGHIIGQLEVGYVDQWPAQAEGPFLTEERDLIRLIADHFAHLIERHRTDEQLQRLAYRDELTGLSSSKGFAQAVECWLRSPRQQDKTYWVVLLDLYHFNDINQAFGHEVGDQLLCAIADRLVANTYRNESIARVAGDQFALLLERTRATTGISVAEWLNNLMQPPFPIGEHSIPMSVTSGIVEVTEADADLSVTEILRRAQLTFHTARESNKGDWSIYDAAMDEQARARIQLTSELRDALEREEFELHFQPKVDLADGRIRSAEALLRWNHPQRGLLPPDSFIAVAEASRAILPLGEWVIRSACARLRAWQDEGLPVVCMAVNVSMVQFTEVDLAEQVEAILTETGVLPHQLSLELTESLLEHEPELVLEQMRRLRKLGVGMALDDFGTGYSSLGHLHRYPFQEIKIDRQFVNGIVEQPYSEEIVRMIVRIAQIMDCEIVAEGVETEAHRRKLLELGCRIGQGYLFSPPLSVEDYHWLLVNHPYLPLTSAKGNVL